ncbi:Predicted membrane protein [Cardiobacterium valvarum]|uniref:Predicted membrane protein n=1 Tax=Cardiobacterium valvarum TaxID=194702 RepID=A0A381EDN1_9GAMM|nr:DUF2339 domain-containing protein [Cardiobacterium valvarum]SUX25062.1 Predicted membrane protein [Cardiobacterium valvarum]
MNGCAAALLYFVIILPASIALDFAFGTEGMLTVLGLIFGFCWLVARGNKAQQDDSAGAPDQPRSYYGYGNDHDARHSADETALRSELTTLQQQIATLQNDVRAIETRLAHLAAQPATARAMPLNDIRRYIHTPLPAPEPAPLPPTPDKETDGVWAYDLPDVTTTPATTPPKAQDKPAAARTVAPETAVHYRPAQPAINHSEPAPRPAAPADNNAADAKPNPLTAWLSENLLLKTGIAILFLGLAFLLRYASARIHISIPLRYCVVATTAIVLGFAGWRLRHKRRYYALAVQGASLAILYLTTLAALKLHDLIPPAPAFILMVAATGLLVALAVVQDALILAQIALIGGLAAPILTSSGSNNYIGLFSYLALLNSGVALIARYKAWRSLNLTGFIGTTFIAGAWGSRYYQHSDYLAVQPFLIYHLVLYTLIVWLYARHRTDDADPPTLDNNASLHTMFSYYLSGMQRIGVLDSALLIASALGFYTLQYHLATWAQYGAALSALAFAAWYTLCALYVRGSDARLHTLAILAALFATTAIPLALDPHWTVSSWAIQAALVYTLAHSTRSPITRLGALLLYLLAAITLCSQYRLSGGDPALTGPLAATVLALLGGITIQLAWWRSRSEDSACWEKNLTAACTILTLGTALDLPLLLLPTSWALTAWLIEAAIAYHIGLRSGIRTLSHTASATHIGAIALLLGEYRITPYAETLISGPIHTTLIIIVSGAANILSWRKDSGDANGPADTAAQRLFAILTYAATLALPLGILPPARAAVPIAMTATLLALIQQRYSKKGYGDSHPAGRVYGKLATLMVTCGALLALTLAAGESAPLTLTALIALATAWLQQRRDTADTLRNQSGWLLLTASSGALVWVACTAPSLAALAPARATWAINLTIAVLTAAGYLRWRQAAQSTLAYLPLLFLALLLDQYPMTLTEPGSWFTAIAAAAVLHLILLARYEAGSDPVIQRHRAAAHLAGTSLFTLAGLRLGHLLGVTNLAPDSIWQLPLLLATPLAILWLATLPAVQEKTRRYPATYHHPANPACGLTLLILAWYNLSHDGNAAPFPYLPVINPLELVSLVALYILWRWWQTCIPPGEAAHSAAVASGWEKQKNLLLGFTLWLIISLDILRIWHHYLGVPWEARALLASFGVQATLSLVWSICAIALMLRGHSHRRRSLWLAGATLIGIVVVKLFLVELADTGGIARIVSFIGVGILLLIVSYIAPAPGKDAEKDT